ncbi:MAG TPA: Pls/PosA family non-ribosomal peptide synthetase [Pseudonocardiaceae bacterium]
METYAGERRDVKPPACYPSRAAAPERTLLDVLDATTAAFPDAAALDLGTTILTYAELAADVSAIATRLAAHGVGPGDRVGVRLTSGTAELYLTILGVLAAGAAYVPADVDDPDERAEMIWKQAGVCLVVSDGGEFTTYGSAGGVPGRAKPGDDAWIIFTSGSTGAPKGVAVTHRSAAAFVDAEAGLFLPQQPIGPGDRVLAGLSVAFDASCEEMWLAWRNGACLVPATRALVKAGAELGPWLVERRISVVSTVPTLAGLWPVEALAGVRLLILGGEACPAELVNRLAAPTRQIWNTYGPTEATVVACATELTAGEPVRIGLPLAGWDLAVVDPGGRPVGWDEAGELIIGGVGLARYLDPVKDAEKFAAIPELGWDRAYRTGDLVRADRAGLVFLGRGDGQVKLGGRRLELGEIDAALLELPGVVMAASAVRRTEVGNPVLVGYVVLADGVTTVDRTALARILPPALIPLIAVLAELPTRTSGKVDRDALPWPLPVDAEPAELDTDQQWLAEQWRKVLGIPVGADADFVALGGSSLAAAQLVSLLRERCPALSVTDLYRYPVLSTLAARMAELGGAGADRRVVRPVPGGTGLVQFVITILLLTFNGLRWLTALGAVNDVLAWLLGPQQWAPTVPWQLVLVGWLVLISVPGRVLITGLLVRALTNGIRPGLYRRGGVVHLRLWTAERLVTMTGLAMITGTHWCTRYAKLVGCQVAEDVALHALPPVTGLARFGPGAVVEAEADVAGWWLDGDILRIGTVTIGTGARIGTRTTLMPGAVIGAWAQVPAGTNVDGTIPAGQAVAADWPRPRVAHRPGSQAVYSAALLLIGLLPVLAALPGLLLTCLFLGQEDTLAKVAQQLLILAVPVTVLSVLCYAALLAVLIRWAGLGLRPGIYPADGPVAVRAWFSAQLMVIARTTLFPFYASLFTPRWLRLLGARIGTGVEASTVLAVPGLLTVADAAFLADDALLAPYEIRGGWLRLGTARVGERAFVGNSGIVEGGRRVPDSALVGVLSTAPSAALPGSSWLGRPVLELARTADSPDDARTFAPPRRLVFARAAVECCRAVPVVLSMILSELAVLGLEQLAVREGFGVAAALGGVVLFAVGLQACLVAAVAKWLLVGSIRRDNHSLWTSFVWRNELADTFVEQLAVPWLVRLCYGTPLLTLWFRALGARIGRGVWCETHWLPETDLVEIGSAATVNRGCVVQTHLFHDRLMRLDTVRLGAGATLGPHAIALPETMIGSGTTVGPASLVLRGERLPAHSRWLGNPVSAWTLDQ